MQAIRLLKLIRDSPYIDPCGIMYCAMMGPELPPATRYVSDSSVQFYNLSSAQMTIPKTSDEYVGLNSRGQKLLEDTRAMFARGEITDHIVQWRLEMSYSGCWCPDPASPYWSQDTPIGALTSHDNRIIIGRLQNSNHAITTEPLLLYEPNWCLTADLKLYILGPNDI